MSEGEESMDRQDRGSRPPPKPVRQPGRELFPIPWWQIRYGLAILIVAVTWLLRELLVPDAGERSPFLAFGLAVLTTALIAGFGPGLLASFLSSAIASFFYLAPRHTLVVEEPLGVVGLGLFALEGLAAAIAGGFVRGSILREKAFIRAGDRLSRFLHHAEELRGQGRGEHPEHIEDLTERELEVARLLARGLANEQIASVLFVSRNTVKTHLKHVYEKLGVKTRTEAVARCLELGLLSPSEPRSATSDLRDDGSRGMEGGGST